jgi:hypothetical protein
MRDHIISSCCGCQQAANLLIFICDYVPPYFCMLCRSGAAAANVAQQRCFGTLVSKYAAAATGAASLTAKTAMAGERLWACPAL